MNFSYLIVFRCSNHWLRRFYPMLILILAMVYNSKRDSWDLSKRSDGKMLDLLSAWLTNWEDYKQNLQTKFESFQVEENKTDLECPRLQSWFFTCRNCADFHRHNIKSMWPFDDIFLAKKLNLPNFHVIWLLLPTTRWRDQRTGTRQAVYSI